MLDEPVDVVRHVGEAVGPERFGHLAASHPDPVPEPVAAAAPERLDGASEELLGAIADIRAVDALVEPDPVGPEHAADGVRGSVLQGFVGAETAEPNVGMEERGHRLEVSANEGLDEPSSEFGSEIGGDASRRGRRSCGSAAHRGTRLVTHLARHCPTD